MIGGNLAQARMVQHPFRAGCNQCQPRQLWQGREAFTQAILQLHQHVLWHQAAHAQLHQRLLRFTQFVQHRSAPMLPSPVPINLRQPRPRMVTIAHQLKHLL